MVCTVLSQSGRVARFPAGQATSSQACQTATQIRKRVTDTSIGFAQRIYESRRRRKTLIDRDIFAEPAWDILLLLYWYTEKIGPLSVTGVCASMGIPATTGARWIQALIERGLVRKEPDSTGLCVNLLALSSDVKPKIKRYLDSLARDLRD